MKFLRKRPPDGTEVSEEYAAGMRAMEQWYQEFVVWAYAYISLLEKRLQERDRDGRSQSEQTDSEKQI